VLSPALTSPLVLTNTATITAPFEMRPNDNLAQAVLEVSPPTPPKWVIWLPVIMREEP